MEFFEDEALIFTRFLGVAYSSGVDPYSSVGRPIFNGILQR